ncbi:MAG: IS256 family transposase [Rhodobacteraceae bacterium]|nr:IS256 family transposase [Paracoccaceae bacterium]
MTSNVYEFAAPAKSRDQLTELIRMGARQIVHLAVEAELQDVLASYSDHRLEDGRAGVIRNGYQPARQIQTGIGPVSVRIPKIRSRTGEPATFRSALVPPYIRKSRSLDASISWLYLKGVSTGEMGPALEALVGPDAKGLSASTVARLKTAWRQECDEWRQMPLDRDRWVHVWADGIHGGLRVEHAKLCCLVVIDVNDRGEKKLLAVEDGVRESTQGWREVLLGLKARGMNAPELAVGDGAMGFWSAQEEIWPGTRQQRCWMYKSANVLNAMPKSVQPKAKAAIHDIWQADTREAAEAAFDLFIETWEDKYPKATHCLEKDRDELITFYDYPAKHWRSIRTTNPIESTFATIRHRTRRSKGCLTRDGMLNMIFKLGLCAEGRWRRLHGFGELGKVITGVKFRDGIEVVEGAETNDKSDNQPARIAA